MKRFYCWSGGVDSSASLLIGKELGIDCDGVVMSEVMFSHKENISAENPVHINWVHDYGIPFVQSLGYNVILVKSDKDFLDYFHKVRTSRSKYFGLKLGFPMVGRGKCELKIPLKIKPMQDFFKTFNEPVEQIVGICADEPQRFSIFNNITKRSLLKEYGITHSQCFNITRDRLLSPYYFSGCKRQGCFFCPNQSISSFANLAVQFPHLFNRIISLFDTPGLIRYKIKPNLSFCEFIKQVNAINSQINYFDLIDNVCRYHE